MGPSPSAHDRLCVLLAVDGDGGERTPLFSLSAIERTALAFARATIGLQAPLAFDSFDENRATGAFILIDEQSNDTVAAGMIAAA